jgi:hypothetical protein
MNQTGDSSNFVQIGDAGSNNVYNVAQNLEAVPNYVQLKIDRDRPQGYSKAEVEKQAVVGGVFAATPLVTTFAALFADRLGILDHLGLPKHSATLVGLCAGIALTLLSIKISPRSRTSLQYWISSKFAKQHEAKRVGLNEFLEVDEKGNYLTYCYAARCIYLGCSGTIVVEELPPREKDRDGLAGMCSVAKRAHSYLIDKNWVATKEKLDWRPEDTPSHYPRYRR